MQVAIWTPSPLRFTGVDIEPCSKKLSGNALPRMKANETGAEGNLLVPNPETFWNGFGTLRLMFYDSW